MRNASKIIVISAAILSGIAAGYAERDGLMNTCGLFILLAFTFGSIGLVVAFVVDDY